MMEAVLLAVTIALGAGAQLLWKARALVHAGDPGGAAGAYVASMVLDPWIWGAVACTGLGMFSWMLVLRRLDLMASSHGETRSGFIARMALERRAGA